MPLYRPDLAPELREIWLRPGLFLYQALVISRASHAFAYCQSRITVMGDTFNTSAVSSTLSPPKYRISTTWLFRSSRVASLSSASSKAISSAHFSADNRRAFENEI